ncbi:hypothetical protein DIJ64_05325 [Mycobacterium leprae]|uniref:Uncharacterized protein n=1 Tax=Mycobacterium leprae TaxID=1769 RepID=A0AAD0KQT4_MYCLR|nr:hypothetical protein [Mycobacterium leprae]AWV47702.1 hypothetical protein DIJ64_05325 [Mycobacterium leprae]OAR21464.1 hypothetical protein A8144_06045 [Mycobacterium leprae 3125609]OAX71277.1 hypothetical protein A3216_06625 [Mycobacterium leprae 7935681]
MTVLLFALLICARLTRCPIIRCEWTWVVLLAVVAGRDDFSPSSFWAGLLTASLPTAVVVQSLVGIDAGHCRAR